MTSNTGIEGVLDTSIAYIRGAQEAKLAEVAALDWAYPMDMPSFAAVRVQEPIWGGEPQFPVLYAVPLGDVGKPAAGGGRVAVTARVVWVALVEHAGTPDLVPAEAAMRLAGRYIRAVRAMLKELHSHPDRPLHWFCETPTYGRNHTRDSGEWLADAQLQTTIEFREA